jgi:hypothetical protein
VPLSGAGSLVTPERAAPRWFASHELRTPLQAIKGGVELLLEERGTGLSALQVEALGLIVGATAELEQSIAMLAELATLPAEPGVVVEQQPLGAWLARPEIARHLSPTPQLQAAASLEVLVAPELAARALGRLVATTGSGSPAEPLGCALASIDGTTCELGLAIGHPASGNGAIGWQLATALLERAGISLRHTGPATTVLTLRRAG